MGSFSAALGGSFDLTRTNLRDYKISISMPTLLLGRKENSSYVANTDWKSVAESYGWTVDCDHPNRHGTYLQARLGLQDWLQPGVDTERATQILSPNSPAPPAGPQITSLTPEKGTAGTLVMIKGSNFTAVTPIWINGDAAPSEAVHFYNSSTMTLTMPKQLKSSQLIIGVGPKDKNGNPTDVGIFTYIGKENETVSLITAAAAPGAGNASGSSSSQSPTISGTFTFILKTSGNLGSSFTLSRVSGGSNNLLSFTRTDNNSVNVVLTPATYTNQPATSLAAADHAREPRLDELQAAFSRIDSALLNLNLQHALSQ